MPRVPHLFGLVAALVLLADVGCTSTTEIGSAAGASERGGAPAVQTPVAATTMARQLEGPPISGLGARINRQRDAYVLLSGGGTPLSNNYSQYLQARAIAEFFERECPRERTWIFFGVGNREGEAPVLADARRELKRDGLLMESWLPGLLPRNRPATRESFLQALRAEILPLVRDGGTLYLFVGDHGELSGARDQRESAITMWQWKRNTERTRNWSTDDDQILGVTELRKILAEGLGEGRVVFGMTQCHGGGFHELGVAREMIPPRAWFSGRPPAWAVGSSAGLHLRVAGFTATDEASPAAGCDADPDPERWAGYERFLPESLLGIDLMSGRPKGRSATSLADAHEMASLVDQTIDKPRSTSEHYLEAWARLIETRLARELILASDAQAAVTAFEQAVNHGRISVNDAALRERQKQFERFTQRIAEEVPAAKELLLTGTRQQLDAAIRPGGARGGGGRGNRRGALTELRRTWTETLRPAWKSAVLEGRVADLSGPALEFEKQLLKREDGGRDFFLPRGANADALQSEIFWASSYADPGTLNRGKAEAVARWGAERRPRIVAWGKSSPSADVRAAAEKIGPGPAFVEEQPRPLSRKTAAERVLFYRRVLAAWEFLVTMRAQPALTELQTLIELERMPVRPGT